MPVILILYFWSNDDAIAINYCIIYAKHYIYLEKLKDEIKKEFNIDFLVYLCYLKYTLRIEKKYL